jgi:outer membrane receptor for monomeric catechols
LAASTVARKGFSKPLIDTSHMINSIDHAVVER